MTINLSLFDFLFESGHLFMAVPQAPIPLANRCEKTQDWNKSYQHTKCATFASNHPQATEPLFPKVSLWVYPNSSLPVYIKMYQVDASHNTKTFKPKRFFFDGMYCLKKSLTFHNSRLLSIYRYL